MSGIKRWLDDPEADTALRALLQADVADASAHSLAGLESKIAAAIAVNAMPSVGMMAGSGSLIVLSVVAAVATGMIGFTAGRLTAPESAPIVVEFDAARPTLAVVSNAPDASKAVVSNAPDASKPATKPETKPASKAQIGATTERPRTKPASIAASTGMQEELLLFERGEAAQSEGRHAAAAEALSRYLAFYPHGRLAPEARLGLLQSLMVFDDVEKVVDALPGFWAEKALVAQHAKWAARVGTYFASKDRCDLVAAAADKSKTLALSQAWDRVLNESCADTPMSNDKRPK